ncbi:hypothetical protein E8E15_003726 [Penicillium rubens]|uniref:Pc21g07900 protein n=2 Tax=Penicillium chrysogenum species complex TaxID=254878 RepID=B6HL84_PENRW|nr:uncharacterized protein N7525_007255 [Penicillium rubens]KZN88527.1 hypothetical protein EN45_071020 [Penicillium chrysogenum]CAP95687.1 Pc21g07900 [Penicillium rubens Wisconsin 54-1255]KAF3027984.1 hypothetical protein E8E15_003726 [Penicillium rubens]KAJ5049357.1 hypothetical protein NUH16_007875 [Penicillium rubens]KAJ5829002.1 hypothetical protein N7525_007255 [Penicillium rubens]
MTTASVAGGYWTFENYGPMTTTFTPASSCTATDRLSLAWVNDDRTLVQFQVGCPTSTSDWDCMPPGTTTSATWYDEKKWVASVGYYSPGLYCPSGWETIGMAARDGKSLSTSGFLTTSVKKIPSYEEPVTLLASLLEPSQTLALCCPSSMTPNGLGQCIGQVPTYKPSVGCEVYVDSDYSWEKVTRTQVYSGVTETNTYDVNSFVSATTSTSSTSFPAGVEHVLTAMSFVPMVTMVHHRSDLEAAGVTGGSTSVSSTGVEAGTGTVSSKATGTAASTSNAAYRLGSRASTLDGFGGIIGGLAVAGALGVTMIIL